MKTFFIKPEIGEIGGLIDNVMDELKSFGLNSGEITKTALSLEESLVKFIEHAKPGSRIRVDVSKRFKKGIVRVKAPGEKFAFFVDSTFKGLDLDLAEESAGDTIRNILISSLSDRIRYDNRNGTNLLRIEASGRKIDSSLLTILMMAAGLLLGILLRISTPESFCTALNTYAFSAIRNVFINLLKFCVVPIVFLSLATCMSEFKDFAQIGKIGLKTFLYYNLTSLIACLIGLGLFEILKPVSFGILHFENSAVEQASAPSVFDTIINIFPSNIISPFASANMLQIMLAAILVGISVAVLGDKASQVAGLMNALDEVFMQIVKWLIKLIPIVSFCSMASLAMSVDAAVGGSIVTMILTVFLGTVIMMSVYLLGIKSIARLDPVRFIKKYSSHMPACFSLCSSNGLMPQTMDICDRKLGISPKIYSFSIPFGATINMDGSCVQFTLCSLSLAWLCGIKVTNPATLAYLVLTILLLSAGMPGIPGAGIVSFTVLLSVLGIPTDVMPIVIGIEVILDGILTTNNVMGDVAISLIIAKQEGLLDEDVFNS